MPAIWAKKPQKAAAAARPVLQILTALRAGTPQGARGSPQGAWGTGPPARRMGHGAPQGVRSMGAHRKVPGARGPPQDARSTAPPKASGARGPPQGTWGTGPPHKAPGARGPPQGTRGSSWRPASLPGRAADREAEAREAEDAPRGDSDAAAPTPPASRRHRATLGGRGVQTGLRGVTA